MENQMDNSALNASQDYLNEHAQSSNWMSKATSWMGNVDMNKLPESLKQYGATAADRVKNMSTTQKVVGGAILAAGAWYLASKNKTGFRPNAAHTTRKES
ncbi:MAG: hypothetical protein ACO1NZ_05270 [Adhaeribacter sp.]|jgi:hypothetical protein